MNIELLIESSARRVLQQHKGFEKRHGRGVITFTGLKPNKQCTQMNTVYLL